MNAGGRGVPQSYSKAARWHREAAEQGNADSQRTLGEMYRKGLGLPQDYAEAHLWFNLAASRAETDRDRDDAVKGRDAVPGQRGSDLSSFEKTSQIGDRDDYWFGNFGGIYVSSQSVFVLDLDRTRVFEFSHALAFKKEFGRRGRGPGEFQRDAQQGSGTERSFPRSLQRRLKTGGACGGDCHVVELLAMTISPSAPLNPALPSGPPPPTCSASLPVRRLCSRRSPPRPFPASPRPEGPFQMQVPLQVPR